jgi:hypothetical protein
VKPLPLLVAFCGLAGLSAGESPFSIAGGFCFPSSQAKGLTSDRGFHAAAGIQDPQPAIIGLPSLDFDWSRVSGQGNRIDLYSVCYSERAYPTQSFYFGLGVGSFYSRILLADPDSTTTQKWRLGSRGMLGLVLNPTMYVELSYFYTGSVNGIDVNTTSMCLGLRF